VSLFLLCGSQVYFLTVTALYKQIYSNWETWCPLFFFNTDFRWLSRDQKNKQIHYPSLNRQQLQTVCDRKMDTCFKAIASMDMRQTEIWFGFGFWKTEPSKNLTVTYSSTYLIPRFSLGRWEPCDLLKPAMWLLRTESKTVIYTFMTVHGVS